MEPPDDYSMSSAIVSSVDLAMHFDSVVDEAFVADMSDSFGTSGDDVDFADALSQRTEMSKMSMSLGSTSGADHDDDIFQASSLSASSTSGVSKDFLSKVWMISPDQAEKTLEHTTQLCKQQGENHLSRHYTTNDCMLRYKRLKSTFYTDTLLASVKSKRGNTCAQLFVSDKGYVAVYPMKSQSEFNQALRWFLQGCWCCSHTCYGRSSSTDQ